MGARGVRVPCAPGAGAPGADGSEGENTNRVNVINRVTDLNHLVMASGCQAESRRLVIEHSQNGTLNATGLRPNTLPIQTKETGLKHTVLYLPRPRRSRDPQARCLAVSGMPWTVRT